MSVNAAFFFKLAGLLLATGQTTAALGDIVPLESTLVPLVEGDATLAQTLDALAALDSKTIQAEADALCGLIQVATKLLIDPRTKAQAVALVKGLTPVK